jgi:hypothetical protein
MMEKGPPVKKCRCQSSKLRIKFISSIWEFKQRFKGINTLLSPLM